MAAEQRPLRQGEGGTAELGTSSMIFNLLSMTFVCTCFEEAPGISYVFIDLSREGCHTILSLRNSSRFPLVLGFPRGALAAYDALPGS